MNDGFSGILGAAAGAPIQIRHGDYGQLRGLMYAQQQYANYAQQQQYANAQQQQYANYAQQQYANVLHLAAPEPEIPTEMEDWDKEFWRATGIVVEGTTCRELVGR